MIKSRDPLKLPADTSLLLARFCIEKRDSKEIDFNANTEERLNVIKHRLGGMVQRYTTYGKGIQHNLNATTKEVRSLIAVYLNNSLCLETWGE